jgi:hypothetical protein
MDGCVRVGGCVSAGERVRVLYVCVRVRPRSFVKADDTDNGYAKPIHGLIVHVDITAKKVALVEDHGATSVPQGREGDRYDSEHLPVPRNDLKAIEITQPEGPSFTVTDGNKITWLDWELRTHIHPTHALELRAVSIQVRRQMSRCTATSVLEAALLFINRNPPESVHRRIMIICGCHRPYPAKLRTANRTMHDRILNEWTGPPIAAPRMPLRYGRAMCVSSSSVTDLAVPTASGYPALSQSRPLARQKLLGCDRA